MDLRTLHRVVRRSLRKSRLALEQCTDIATMTAESNIVVFLRTNEELSQKMLRLPRGRYPLELLMNHYTVYGALAAHFMQGELSARSEPFTATFADIPGSVHTPERGLWGTSVDTVEGIWQVPDLATELPSSVNWRSAVLTEVWPPHPVVSSSCPNLALIHVPDRLVPDPADWMKILELSWGYNTVAMLARQRPNLIKEAIATYRVDVETARSV